MDKVIAADETVDAVAMDANREAVSENRKRAGVKESFLKLRRGITMDSGAANNVMPRRMIMNKKGIRPSKGPRSGVHYVAANNGRIPTEGEHDFKFMTNEGDEETMTFQVAEVNKALGSISYLVDKGYKVVFDQDEETGKDISHMFNKKTGKCVRFRRERNVWILDAYIPADEAHFQRQ